MEIRADTYYVGMIKGVGRIYQQTFIDTYSRVAFAKVYDRKTALVAADTLNDKVLPFFQQHDIPLMRILTDRGTEYCGARENHEYQLYLTIEDVDHTKTKAKSPQTNGICAAVELNVSIKQSNRAAGAEEFYSVAFRKKVYNSLEQIQQDLESWLEEYNKERSHSGRYCYGKTPYQTFTDSLHLPRIKLLGQSIETSNSSKAFSS